ncbi:unnamed protein product, partial [Meganyctiphanes norvegica]
MEEECRKKNTLNPPKNLYLNELTGSFTDDYHLVTYKILSSMYWVKTRCPSVPWVIRADDDILVDVYLLHKLLPRVALDGINCDLRLHQSMPRLGVLISRQQPYSSLLFQPCGATLAYYHWLLMDRWLWLVCLDPYLWL